MREEKNVILESDIKETGYRTVCEERQKVKIYANKIKRHLEAENAFDTTFVKNIIIIGR